MRPHRYISHYGIYAQDTYFDTSLAENYSSVSLTRGLIVALGYIFSAVYPITYVKFNALAVDSQGRARMFYTDRPVTFSYGSWDLYGLDCVIIGEIWPDYHISDPSELIVGLRWDENSMLYIQEYPSFMIPAIEDDSFDEF